jgi:pimeloyl-ACP methyl ester carboxylesterase
VSATVPTLVIVGDEGIACPPRLSQPIREAMSHAELAVIRGGAHQPFQENPNECNSIVTDFWGRVDRPHQIAAAASVG